MSLALFPMKTRSLSLNGWQMLPLLLSHLIPIIWFLREVKVLRDVEGDIALYERVHADPNIDYLNIHIWPYNWGWVKADSLKELLPRAKENTKKYINDHMVIAQKYKKPVVLEEFGFPRDGFRFSKSTSTEVRDEYYQYVFDLIRQDRENGGLFAGCNFWAWGGFAEQNSDHIYWEKGDDYTGDPAQEEQGLNSVFATDTTVEIIKTENAKLK